MWKQILCDFWFFAVLFLCKWKYWSINVSLSTYHNLKNYNFHLNFILSFHYEKLKIFWLCHTNHLEILLADLQSRILFWFIEICILLLVVLQNAQLKVVLEICHSLFSLRYNITPFILPLTLANWTSWMFLVLAKYLWHSCHDMFTIGFSMWCKPTKQEASCTGLI